MEWRGYIWFADLFLVEHIVVAEDQAELLSCLLPLSLPLVSAHLALLAVRLLVTDLFFLKL